MRGEKSQRAHGSKGGVETGASKQPDHRVLDSLSGTPVRRMSTRENAPGLRAAPIRQRNSSQTPRKETTIIQKQELCFASSSAHATTPFGFRKRRAAETTPRRRKYSRDPYEASRRRRRRRRIKPRSQPGTGVGSYARISHASNGPRRIRKFGTGQ